MQTKIFQLWLGTVKTAVFCVFLNTLLTAECLASGPPPVITVQPLDRTVPNGGTAILTVTATSATTLSYQWNYQLLIRSVPIAGATNSTLTINNVSILSPTKYNVSVINAGGTEKSRDANLTITNNNNTNTAPVANDDAFTTPENSGLISASSVLANDTDANGDPLTALLVTNAAHGSLAFNSNGTFSYMPVINYYGNDSFAYRANDGTTNSRPATVNLTVTFVSTNIAPVANDDTFTTPQNVLLIVDDAGSVLNNDMDANGDPLTALLVTNAVHGSLIFNSNGTFSYSPEAGYCGNDSFTYVANDGTVNSAQATVTITVTSVSNSCPPPIATILDASDLTATAATLNATVNPQSSAARGYFQFGMTTNYGMVTPSTDFAAVTNDLVLAASIDSLTPLTTYHYCVVATGPGGTSISEDAAFTTSAAESALLTVLTNGLGGISPDLNGSLLVIGQSYTLTATPATSLVFNKWTDAGGATVTTNPVLTFLMSSNLSFTANFADVTKPTLSITNLVASSSVSNEWTTAKGSAGDNLSVANVFYNFNSTGWTVATTENNWTNWSAALDLMAGSNTLSAYAVDASGNLSTTNTVRVVYVPVATLTVRTNGGGGISPALNGAVLLIGQSYTLTATNAPGFVFTNWTDAGGVIVTNRMTLTFVMASNLSLTANFVDVIKPTLSITNLAASSTVSNEWITAKGNAGDNVSVAGVFYNFNNTGWTTAATGNNWTNWSTLLDLRPGTNTLSAYAVDVSGIVSTTNTVRCVYIPVATLTVRTNGRGGISPALNGAVLRIGQSCTLTATNGAGYVFTNWTDAGGVIVTNTPALTFLMASNLSFTANFVDVIKPVLTVTSPLATTSAANEFYPASGKATDNVAVANVSYQLNGGGWYAATTTNNWTNWVATLDLTPGTNSFSAQAADTSGNLSAAVTVKFVYATAPASLNGLKAVVTPDGLPAFDSAFGVSTFSQYSKYTNSSNGVGGYTYTKLTPNTGSLVITYTAPPTTTNAGVQNIVLAFTAPGLARFSNQTDGSTGDMVFSSATNLVPASLLNRTVVFVGSQGQGQSNLYTATNYVSIDVLTRSTNKGTSYSYAAYSPVGALLKQTDTNGQTYIVTSYTGTNYGATYSESYNPAGSLIGADLGFVGLVSQRAGGNAPTNLFNRSLSFASVGSQFKLSLGTNTFAQYSPTPAYSSGVGGYVYSRANTNTGILSVNYLAPSDISGSTNVAKLMFFAYNLAVFTNADGTVGGAVLGNAANLAPATLAGKTVNTTNNVTGNLNQLSFAGDNTFGITGYLNDTGSYTFATYSPESGLAQLTFTGGDLAGDTGSLQLHYVTAFTGRYVLSIFDSTNNLVGSSRGSFGQP